MAYQDPEAHDLKLQPPAYADLTLGEPNVRHNYENTTYDITLAMATERDTDAWLKKESETEEAVSPSMMNTLDSDLFKDELTILAQTGTTTAQVTSLEIASTAAPTKANNLTYSSNFNMTVTQPLGVDFLRDIYTTAAMRGIQNHYTHPYFLQIFLKGRNKDGIEEVEVPGTRRLYCIYISNITYKVEQGGSIYTVTAIRASDMGLNDDHNLVSGIAMENIDSFGDFIKEFEKSLREIERHNLGQTKLILDQYAVKVVGAHGKGASGYSPSEAEKNEFLNAKIIQDFDKKNLAIQDVKTGAVKVEIEKNTKVTDILEKFINRNKWVVDYMAKIKEDYIKAFSEKDWEKVNVDKLVPTISTYTQNIAYDPLRRDYARKYFFVINLTKSTTPPIGIRQEWSGNQSYTNKRIKNYREDRRIRKRYDYNFTGINIDVLNFDLEYNYQYVYGLDTLTGLYNKYGDVFFSDITNEQLNSQKRIDEARAKSGQASNYWSAANKDGKITGEEKFQIAQLRYEILKKAREMLQQPGVEPDANTINAYNELVKDFNDTRMNYEVDTDAEFQAYGGASKQQPGGGKLNTLDPSTAVKNSKSSSRKPGARVGQVYAENFRDGLGDDYSKVKGSSKEYGAEMGTTLPIQFYGRNMKPGAEGMVGAGEGTAFKTMLDNAKIGSAEMVKVTLDIVGDTFWLDDPAASANAIDPDKFNRRKENVVLFHTVFPQQPDPKTGMLNRLDQREDQFLTALYKVWKVDHSFSDGLFNTRLHLVRDSLTDLALMTERSKTDEETTQESVTADDGFKNNSTAVKKDPKKTTEVEKAEEIDVIGSENQFEMNKVTAKNAEQVSGSKPRVKEEGPDKRRDSGFQNDRDKFNEYYQQEKYQKKSAQWNADKTRVIGGL